MPTLEEIRKKKLRELMNAQQDKWQQQTQEQQQVQQQIEQMEGIVKQFLTKESLMRYGSLKAAHQEKALHLLVVLFQSIQKGQIKGNIEDSLIKKILEQLTPKKREMKIKRV